MKTCLLLLMTIAISNQSYSQNEYIEYYNLVNQANRNWYEKNYTKSLKNFQEAFTKVEYAHSINFAKAARSAAKLKDHKLTKIYILEAVKRGYPNNYIDRKLFKKFRKSTEYKELRTEIDEVQLKGDLSINKVYQRKIDSLHYIDQKIIRGSNNVTDFNLDLELEYSDSSNFACLLNLINLYGFPSEQNIGFHGYGKSWVIIHHNARLPKNHNYHSTLLKYLKSGDYLPENYCWVIDQSKEINKEVLVYYHWD
ncbi:hypothetical protein OAU00_03630, partial [Saprospiraceae bacterium]|nr:hypothetical protein [Saprospiraceae bacterium]